MVGLTLQSTIKEILLKPKSLIFKTSQVNFNLILSSLENIPQTIPETQRV